MITALIDLLLQALGYPPIHWIDDGWFGRDKVFHFLLHFGIVGVQGFLLPCLLLGRTHWLIVAFSVLFSFVFGFLYEMYDSARKTGASGKDILWNEIGAFVAVVVGVIVLV